MKKRSGPRRLPDSRGSSSRRVFSIVAVAVLLAIVLLTQLPMGVKQLLHTRGRFHTAGHVIAFTVLAFAAGKTQKPWTTRLLLPVGLILFGFLTELAEFYSITLEWRDVLGDSAGTVLGSALAMLTTRRAPLRAEKISLS